MANFVGRINHAIKSFSQPAIQKIWNVHGTFLPAYRFVSTLSQIRNNASPLLQACTPNIQQTCGMKVKGQLRRRCKDCYFVWREERFYVMCKTHGRHKQMSMKRKPHNTWILTHASQSKIREW